MINQLFIKQPPRELILTCLGTLGFADLTDASFISKETMNHARATEAIKTHINTLKEYYGPSKAKIYLHNLDLKKCITIVRQLIKTIGYDLLSKEKMTSGRKVLYYRVITIEAKKRKKKNPPIKPTIVNFD